MVFKIVQTRIKFYEFNHTILRRYIWFLTFIVKLLFFIEQPLLFYRTSHEYVTQQGLHCIVKTEYQCLRQGGADNNQPAYNIWIPEVKKKRCRHPYFKCPLHFIDFCQSNTAKHYLQFYILKYSYDLLELNLYGKQQYVMFRLRKHDFSSKICTVTTSFVFFLFVPIFDIIQFAHILSLLCDVIMCSVCACYGFLNWVNIE